MGDDETIKKALAGDSEAFALLVETHLSSVYNFILRLVRNPEEAEDITQDVFVKVWRHLKKYREGANFKTWLFTIARNTVIDWSRKKKSFVFSDFEDGEGNNVLVDTLADLEPLPDEIFRRAEDEKFFDDLLAKLSPASREVLLLHYRESLTFDEIAGVVGKSLNTVKSQHRRALEILRKMM